MWNKEVQRRVRKDLAKKGLLWIVCGRKDAYSDYNYLDCYHVITSMTMDSMSQTAAIFTSPRIGIHAVIHHGSYEMKQKYIAPCLSGDTSWSFCLTGPEAGSDLLACETNAERKHHNTWI